MQRTFPPDDASNDAFHAPYCRLARRELAFAKVASGVGDDFVKITLLPSNTGPNAIASRQYATSFLINNHVAIDAGSLGYWRSPAEQAAVRHLFISHTHMDHVASLPIFLENVIGLADSPVVAYASAAVQECLRGDMFAGRLWANFLELTHDGKPFVILRTLESGQSVEVEGLRITAVAVNHTVPTVGYIIEEPGATVVIPSDTGPTEEIWQRAGRLQNLKAVFLEATFPNALAPLADITRHLTPSTFVSQMQKLPPSVRFLAVHLKANCAEEVAAELLGYGLPNLEIATFGTAYEF